MHCKTFMCFSKILAHLSWSSSELFWSPVVRRLSVCLSVRLSVTVSYCGLLLKNHWANLNQTWHKASLGERRGFKFVQMKGSTFSKGIWLRKNENTLTKLKNLLFKNHLCNFNKTCHNASLGEGHSSLFKGRTKSFSKRW